MCSLRLAALVALAGLAVAAGVSCGGAQRGVDAAGGPRYTATIVGANAEGNVPYRLVAVGAAGLEGASVGGDTPSTPHRPTGLALFGPIGAPIRVVWGAPAFKAGSPDVTGYNVYRNGTLVGAGRPASPREFVDAVRVDPLAVYRYVVTALNSFGEGPASEPRLTSDLPGPPTGLALYAPNATAVRVVWSAPAVRAGFPEATGYNVYRNGTLVGAGRPASPREFVDAARAGPPAAYRYEVTAITAFGEGPASEPRLAIEAPSPPTGATAAMVSETSVSISWLPPAASPSYYAGYSVVVEGPTIYERTAAAPPLVLSGLVSGYAYGFRVRTVNPFAASQPTSPPTQAAPWSPTITSTAAVSASAIRIEWSSPINYGPPVTRYLVYDGAAVACDVPA